MHGTVLFAVAAAVLVSATTWGDSIKIGDTLYENVYVAEGASHYYVSIPADGRVLNVPKAEVDKSTVSKTVDQAARAEIYRQWEKKARGRNTPVKPAPPTSDKPLLLDPPKPPEPPVKPNAPKVMTPERQQFEMLKKAREVMISEKRRQRESMKNHALSNRRAITSQGGAAGMGGRGGTYGAGLGMGGRR